MKHLTDLQLAASIAKLQQALRTLPSKRSPERARWESQVRGHLALRVMEQERRRQPVPVRAVRIVTLVEVL